MALRTSSRRARARADKAAAHHAAAHHAAAVRAAQTAMATICGGGGDPKNMPYAGFGKDSPDSTGARGDAKPTCEGYASCKECECDPQCAWCIDGGLCNKYCMGLDGESSVGSNAVIVGTYMCRQIEETENNEMDIDEDNYYHHGGIADWKKKEKYPLERPIDNAPAETALKKRAYSPFNYVEANQPTDDKKKLWGKKPYWRNQWNKGAEMGLPKEAGILKGMDPAYPVPAPYGFKSKSSALVAQKRARKPLP